VDFEKIANQTLPSCDSTNHLVKALGEAGYPHGTWVCTLTQTAGKGRNGRHWTSPVGNFYGSILLNGIPKGYLSWTPLALAIGAQKAIAAQGLEVAIKWPNDLCMMPQRLPQTPTQFKAPLKKLGGILCESGVYRAATDSISVSATATERKHTNNAPRIHDTTPAHPGSNATPDHAQIARQTSFVVGGIGINCNHIPAGITHARYQPTSLAEELRRPIDVNIFRKQLFEHCLEAIHRLTMDGAGWLRHEFLSHSVYSVGERIHWGQHQQHTGILEDLGPYGELIVQDSNGNFLHLYSEDI
jgi:biotin-(acetyl-CoA carboxylase) ligase